MLVAAHAVRDRPETLALTRDKAVLVELADLAFVGLGVAFDPQLLQVHLGHRLAHGRGPTCGKHSVTYLTTPDGIVQVVSIATTAGNFSLVFSGTSHNVSGFKNLTGVVTRNSLGTMLYDANI